jgi:hypothetical protein
MLMLDNRGAPALGFVRWQVHGVLARCEAMSDFAHAPLTKALDIAVLIAHAFWRNSGPAGSMPNYTCGPAPPLRCAMACCDAAGLLG